MEKRNSCVCLKNTHFLFMRYIPIHLHLYGNGHMAITVVNAVIHGFEKDQHKKTDPTSIVIKGKGLDVTLPAVKTLVENVAKLLGDKLNTQSWGRFSEDRGGKFYSSFKADVVSIDNVNVFIELTRKAMTEIIDHAAEESGSTGSKILFSHYKDSNGQNRFLVAMIKQKGGITLDEDYVPVGIVEIDMSKLSQAADIRCDEYMAIIKEEALALQDEKIEVIGDEADLKNYLSFLVSRDNSDASGYFLDALGCILNISPKKSTASVISVMQDFFEKNQFLKPFSKSARESVCRYLQERADKKESAKLDEVVHAASSVVPSELKENLEGFLQYFNNDDNRVPSEFYVHKGELSKHIKVVIDADDMHLKFNKSSLGIDVDSKIYYNKKAKSLTIKNLTPKQMEQLERQMS